MATRRRRTASGTRSTPAVRRTRRRTSTSRTDAATRRRTARRARRGTAASFGSAFGLLLVWVLLRAPGWLKIVAVLVALAAAVGYVLFTRRGDGPTAGAAAATDPDAPASTGGPSA